jgi:hypothetical protein
MDKLLRGNPSAIFDRILFCHDLAFESCVPAKIEKVYSDHTALARPLIKIVNETGSVECQPILVTTFWNFHGDFEIHHPLNEGDTGWIIAADRNTDLVKQYNAENDESLNAGAQEPNSDKNLHKYRFGFFFPDRWDKEVIDSKTGRKTKLSVPEELRDCFYIQDRNGWCRIVLDEEGHIAIKAKSSVEIFGDTTIHDDMFCKGDADFALDVSIHGNVKVDGELLVGKKTTLNNGLLVKGEAKVDGNLKVSKNIDCNKKVTCDDIETRDCKIRELKVVTKCIPNVDKSTGKVKSNTLVISKIKLLRSDILESKSVEIKGGGNSGNISIEVSGGSFLNHGYFNVGGITYHQSTVNISDIDFTEPGFVAYSMRNGVQKFASLSDLNTAQRNVDDYVFPLFLIEENGTAIDLQNIPHVQYFEEGLT